MRQQTKMTTKAGMPVAINNPGRYWSKISELSAFPRCGADVGTGPQRGKALYLCLPADGTGNLTKRYSGAVAGGLHLRDIAQRNNADEPLISVKHRQTPDLDVTHIL